MMERPFLREIGMNREEMERLLEENSWKTLAETLLEETDENGRFHAVRVAETAGKTLECLSSRPEEGWPTYTYGYVLGQLFPEKRTGIPDGPYAKGRLFYLHLLKTLFRFERMNLPFDPTLDIRFLRPSEVEEGGYHREYLRFDRMARNQCIYEFMRIGIVITPWNTLGHIAGVHSVAMHVARQLAALKVPVDLGRVSGAAAGHDIGKYGNRKSEERRMP